MSENRPITQVTLKPNYIVTCKCGAVCPVPVSEGTIYTCAKCQGAPALEQLEKLTKAVEMHLAGADYWCLRDAYAEAKHYLLNDSPKRIDVEK